MAYIDADLARRCDPAHSADLGAFMALLSSFRQLARVVASGQLGARSRVDEMDGWWFGFFSYLASGPPPDRLEQLLALAGPASCTSWAATRRSWPTPPPAGSWPAAATARRWSRRSASSRPGCPRPTWGAPATSWCGAW